MIASKVFFSITGREPTFHELDRYVNHSTRTGLWDMIFDDHIKATADKMKRVGERKTVVTKPLKGSIIVMGLVKNVTKYLPRLRKFIEDLRAHVGGDNRVCFFFYHNNSNDEGRSIAALEKWMRDDKNVAGTFARDVDICALDFLTKKAGNRIPEIARMRNECLQGALEHFGEEFDYACIIDTNLAVNIDTNNILLPENDEEWNIVCGNRCFKDSFFHYDIAALGGNSGTDTLYIVNEWNKVPSAFGGIHIVKMCALADAVSEWDGYLYEADTTSACVSEHVSFCERVGGVLINPRLQVITNNHEVIGGAPMVFVPKDTGFFCVFNFFMGSLMTGRRIYPYYNRDVFMKYNKENKHFCYWGTTENSWFDYFEPIAYYFDDMEHSMPSISNYAVTSGEIAGCEFRNPDAVRSLFKSEHFQEWRETVNVAFSNYIKINSCIIKRSDRFWEENDLSGKKVIGVHYRHPSHFVESGPVYLQSYFDKINVILGRNPDAQILLATDNELGLMAFTFKYGSRVKYMKDVKRVPVDNILEWAFAKCTKEGKSDAMDFVDGKGYQLHYVECEKPAGKSGVKLGEDVLCEALCLARCKWFIHSISNIALAVSYMNPHVEMLRV